MCFTLLKETILPGEINIKQVRKEDNYILAKIIRDALTEFKANKPGTVFYDDTTDNLFDVFQQNKSGYFVALFNNEVTGGCGIYPTEGLPADTCELVKLYLIPAVRGKGFGKLLMELCIDEARKQGYKKMYLETMPELTSAIPLYKKFGFTYLNSAMGNSGHNGCTIWMIKEL